MKFGTQTYGGECIDKKCSANLGAIYSTVVVSILHKETFLARTQYDLVPSNQSDYQIQLDYNLKVADMNQ